MGNKTSEDTLFKSRSSSASIKAGYRLYTGSFRKIFKSSWLAALIYAFFFSALGTISVIQVPRLSLQILSDMDNPSGYIDRYIWLTSAIIVLLIVGTIAEVLFYSCGLSLLRQHQKQSSILFPAKWFSFDRHTSLRTLKAALCNIPIALVAAAVVAVAAYCTPRMTFLGAHSHTVAMVFTGLLSVAVAFLLMPLCFVSMKYVMRDDTHFMALLKTGYTVGFRHLGSLFVTILVCFIVIAVAGFVILLPSNILTMANLQANIGLAYGDPLGMPDNIAVITAVTFLLAGFLGAYIRMSALFPMYYLYGAIETRESERKSMGMVRGDGIGTSVDEKSPEK